MQAHLYINNSDKRYLNKVLTNDTTITIHFKDDSNIIEPTIFISRNINMVDYNYIYIPSLKRYYYIDKVIESQQRYEVNASVDVLMSFKTEIMNKSCIVERGSRKYNLYLQDDKLKANTYTHRDTYFFETCFEKNLQEFILTVVGNSDTSYTGGGDSGGGSSNNNNTISITTYEEIPDTEKNNNNQIYTVPDTPPTEEQENQTPNYLNIGISQYGSIPSEDIKQGTFYYVTENSSGVKGYRNINISKSNYDRLTEDAKNNGIPYFVRW